MDRDNKFGVASKELAANWGSRLPSSNEKRAMALFRESEVTSKVWAMLDKRKPKNLKPNFQQEVLRSILKSFGLVAGDCLHRTLRETDEEFEKLKQAIDTLIHYYGQQADIDPSTVKVDEPCQGCDDRRSIWQLRQMEGTIFFRYYLDVSQTVSMPIVSRTRAPADRALNFACCLTIYLEALSGRRSYLDFSIAIAAILYGGAKIERRTLQNHRSKRKRERQSALKRSDSLVFSL